VVLQDGYSDRVRSRKVNMALMIPSSVHDDCKSSAERRLFGRFKTELPDAYTVLHSLGVARHNKKLVAEIDFVVLSPRGILCIEVKGGRISHHSGTWTYTDRYGNRHDKRESPFEQVRSAMFGLIKNLRGQFSVPSPQLDAIIGHVVIFPDAQFTVPSPEWDLERVIDCNAIYQPMDELISEQYDYSASEIKRTRNRTCRDMTKDQLSQLLSYIRPDFDLVRSLSSTIGESHQSLLRLTNEQYEIFENLNDNERIKVYGGAGTGKTLLAVEKARRMAKAGQRVIYLCYNKLLANHVATVLSETEAGANVEVSNLHDYAAKIIDQAGMTRNLKAYEGHELFTKGIPEQFGQAFVEVFDKPPFDLLIVDEGQDLKSNAYIRMIDWLIEGGMMDGNWIWFEDSQQNIFRPGESSEGQATLDKYRPAKKKLNKNCRNTKPISAFTSKTTSMAAQKCLVDSDILVTPLFYTGEVHQRRLIEKTVTGILSGGVDPTDIVILSRYKKKKSALKGIESLGGFPLVHFETATKSKKILRYSTIQKFKGLEAKVVIVTDVTDLKSDVHKVLNYVAFTRPTSCLEVLMHEGLKGTYEGLEGNGFGV